MTADPTTFVHESTMDSTLCCFCNSWVQIQIAILILIQIDNDNDFRFADFDLYRIKKRDCLMRWISSVPLVPPCEKPPIHADDRGSRSLGRSS